MYGEATRSPHRLALQSTRTECSSRELMVGTVVTLAGGYGSSCQRRDSVSPGSRGLSSEEISQVIYLLTLAEQFGCKGDGNEIASTERCAERLRPSETAWIRAHNIAAS